MLKSEAIKRFLDQHTHKDLADAYNLGMECQVNVAEDAGELVTGEYKGKRWRGWTDGQTTWKPFRIPWKAMSYPEYQDSDIKFDISQHADAIGMTGWNWKRKRSCWVAFDFDAIIGHSDKHNKKLTQEELEAVKEAAKQIDWVTVRKSTSGSGLHLYVHLDPASQIDVNNHNEHAALARAILGQMAGLTGFPFATKVDICGGNMWVWARKMRGTDGLSIIKKGRYIKDSEIPRTWRDHTDVIKGKRRRTAPKRVAGTEADEFDDLCSQRPRVKLEDDHAKLIKYIEENGYVGWWDPDSHMLVTHTYALKRAFEDLNLKGCFDTISEGTDTGEQNCFAFPLRRGGWVVRRFTPGVSEHPIWEQDGAGWTRAYLNRSVDLGIAARAFDGIEDPRGGFVFSEAENAIKAAELLGTHIQIDPSLYGRECKLREHKDGRLIIEIERRDADDGSKVPGFISDKKTWKKVINAQVRVIDDPDVTNYDDVVRHVISPGDEDYGWVVQVEGTWIKEPLTHVKHLLTSIGHNTKEVGAIVGNCISRPWRLANRPFESEYPGGREWNKNAAQLRFAPSDSENPQHTTWDTVFNHLGSSIDVFVQQNRWCHSNGILTGGDYLRMWAASLIQHPNDPLPYLFFYNKEENTGKSTFHDSLRLLMTKGCVDGGASLTNQQNFNGELEGAVLCYIEEIDLTRNKNAHNKIKDWVTSDIMLIHPKGQTPYGAVNTTHWVHCANDHSYCPIFRGDTRITMIFVPVIDPMFMIPKIKLKEMLEREAPEFLATLTRTELPEPGDRLRIPVIETDDKNLAAEMNLTQLEQFIKDQCITAPGHMIKFSDFYDRFTTFVGPNDIKSWSKIRVGKELPREFPKGRDHSTGQFYIGNICFEEHAKEIKPAGKIILKGEYLEQVDND